MPFGFGYAKKGKLVAAHRVHATDTNHLCPAHRAIVDWAPDKFIEQAAAIHEEVEHYIRKVL